MEINRWKRAQTAESNKWKSYSLIDQSISEIQKKALNHLCKYTLLSKGELKNKVILEVGGGLIERAFINTTNKNYFSDNNFKITLDPIFPFDFTFKNIKQNDNTYRIKAVGEQIPIKNNTVDICWCENTIDHTYLPHLVLNEFHRVLKAKGFLVISCNIFPIWLKPLFPLFDKFDSPHPHHFSLKDFKKLIGKKFLIKKIFQYDAPLLRISSKNNLKTNIAALLFIKNYYFYCKLK